MASHQTHLSKQNQDEDEKIATELARACAVRSRRAATPTNPVYWYYTHYDRLYYVIDVDVPCDIYEVENCETEYTMWVTGKFLREEVSWIARNRRS